MRLWTMANPNPMASCRLIHRAVSCSSSGCFRAVVMIHGAGFDHSTWALHSRWFAHHGFSVLAPDLPGHGRSGGKPLPTIADMADWTATLLDTAKAPNEPPANMMSDRKNTSPASRLNSIVGSGIGSRSCCAHQNAATR